MPEAHLMYCKCAKAGNTMRISNPSFKLPHLLGYNLYRLAALLQDSPFHHNGCSRVDFLKLLHGITEHQQICRTMKIFQDSFGPQFIPTTYARLKLGK